MQAIWWVLLVLLSVVLLVGVTLIWHRWSLYLHYYEKKFVVELRGFGIRRRVFYRDFAKPKSSGGAILGTVKTKREKPKKPKKKWTSLKDRLERDKKRIYDKEKGGYQHSGLSEVLAEYRENYQDIRKVLRLFLEDTRHRIEISSMEIRLGFGTGNPAHTGMLYGTLWNLVGLGYPILLRYFKAAYPSMEVTPDFERPRFDLEFKSIIKVRPAHIINALLKQGWGTAITYLKQYVTKGSGKNV